jgi:hypothetical protein
VSFVTRLDVLLVEAASVRQAHLVSSYLGRDMRSGSRPQVRSRRHVDGSDRSASGVTLGCDARRSGSSTPVVSGVSEVLPPQAALGFAIDELLRPGRLAGTAARPRWRRDEQLVRPWTRNQHGLTTVGPDWSSPGSPDRRCVVIEIMPRAPLRWRRRR